MDQKGSGINFLSPPISQQDVLSGMDALDTRFDISDSPESPPRLLCGESQSLNLFLEHQQGGHGSCYQSHLIKAPCSYNRWSVLICCSIWVGLLKTHTHTPPPNPHSLNLYGRFCCSLAYLTPPALLDVQEKWGFPSHWLFPPNTNTETGLIWVG